MEAGRVCTGFSLPYVAKYSNSGSTITYSDGQKLARGVSVSVEPDSNGDENRFYADNVAAESIGGVFTGGTLNLTVDGLHEAAEKLIYGLPTATSITVGTTTVSVEDYGDSAEAPYVGVGFVARYMSGGEISYVGYVLPKCKFDLHNDAAETQEEEIDWQTQDLRASIMRADDANHNWKRVTEELETEASAEGAVKAMLSIT